MNENHYARTHARLYETHAESNRWRPAAGFHKRHNMYLYTLIGVGVRVCAWLYTAAADSSYGGRSASRLLRRVDVRPDEHGQWGPGSHLFPDEHYNIKSYCKSSSS